MIANRELIVMVARAMQQIERKTDAHDPNAAHSDEAVSDSANISRTPRMVALLKTLRLAIVELTGFKKYLSGDDGMEYFPDPAESAEDIRPGLEQDYEQVVRYLSAHIRTFIQDVENSIKDSPKSDDQTHSLLKVKLSGLPAENMAAKVFRGMLTSTTGFPERSLATLGEGGLSLSGAVLAENKRKFPQLVEGASSEATPLDEVGPSLPVPGGASVPGEVGESPYRGGRVSFFAAISPDAGLPGIAVTSPDAGLPGIAVTSPDDDVPGIAVTSPDDGASAPPNPSSRGGWK